MQKGRPSSARACKRLPFCIKLPSGEHLPVHCSRTSRDSATAGSGIPLPPLRSGRWIGASQSIFFVRGAAPNVPRGSRPSSFGPASAVRAVALISSAWKPDEIPEEEGPAVRAGALIPISAGSVAHQPHPIRNQKQLTISYEEDTTQRRALRFTILGESAGFQVIHCSSPGKSLPLCL